ncbi:MAG: MCE family protein [Rhodovulum sulfidophilum]|uniref:MCE family protein n=1 Tax=Rhodovulum sulfidophilum TaxID=35806 RepID=A0A2W5NLC0_RHOSU|nr:MAG: MCE family protein [Rhodovulum sulfidophilum]
METRANYVLIGAFTLAGVLGVLGFFIWLANLQLDRQYAHFDILFDNVSGLAVGGDVRFNGVSVGQATSVDLYEKDPSKVIVRVQVDADTPVKVDTTAQLRAQGVTGLSFIELDGGDPRSERLQDANGAVPVIVAQRSIVQTLTQSAPNLLTQATVLMNRAEALLSAQNVAHVAQILGNLEGASASLDSALGEVPGVAQSISQATSHFGDFTAQLDTAGPAIVSALDAAKTTFGEANRALDAATTTLGTANTTFDGANAVIRDEIPPLVGRIDATIQSLDAMVATLQANGEATLKGVGVVADTADARLVELRATIAGLDETLSKTRDTLTTIGGTATSIQTLVDGEGTGLVTDARGTFQRANQALDSLNRTLDQDVPRIVASVDDATAKANAAITQLSTDLTSATGGLPSLIANADRAFSVGAVTFADASRTLAQVGTLADDARGTLAAADTALGTANSVLQTDLAPMAADLRDSAARLSASATTVAADLPAITGQIRDTLGRADQLVAQLNAVAATSGPAINNFAARGLPNFDAFASEARVLVASLDRLIADIQRNPTRFFLGNTLPEYRR